jgi:hypothetical protein
LPGYRVSIVLPLASSWSLIGIVTSVIMVRAGRAGRRDKATRAFEARGAAEARQFVAGA